MNYNKLIIKDNQVLFENNTLYLSNKILNKGIILNISSFIKEYYAFFKRNKASTFFWNKKVDIIYDSNISVNDIEKIKYVFKDIGYKNVNLKSDITCLNIDKKSIYLLSNKEIKVVYRNKYNYVCVVLLNTSVFTKNEIIEFIKRISFKKNKYIIGKLPFNIFDDYENYYIIRSFFDLF